MKRDYDRKRMLASPGICAHSKHRYPLAVISAYDDTMPEHVNAVHHESLGCQLKTGDIGMIKHNGYKDSPRMDIGEVTGKYNGKLEKSWLCELETMEHWDHVMRLARLHKQKCVLHIDEEDIAVLFYTDRPARYDVLGKLVPVSANYAEQLDAWTRTRNGQYYGVTDNG